MPWVLLSQDDELERYAHLITSNHRGKFPFLFCMTGNTVFWGWDISQGRDYLSTAWWITFRPGSAIVLIVISFNILGDWLRDVLDPHLRV